MEFGFFIKKLVSAFMMPLTFTWLILLIGVIFLWSKKHVYAGKWLATFGVVLLYIFSFSLISHFIIAPIELVYPPYKGSNTKISYVVSLGHYSKEDPNIPLSSQLSADTVIRLVESISIYRQHKGSKLIFSGGANQKEGSHPARVRQMAIDLGVPDKDILLVEGPKDTHDEAVAIKPIIGTDTLVLVTSASHMKRAMALFEGQDLNVIAAPTDFQVKTYTGISFFDFFPSPTAIDKMESAIYEYLGLLWVKIRGQN